MQILIWVFRLVVVLVFVWLAAKNADPVTLHGFPGAEITAPLALILLVFFAIGLIMGLLASFMSMVSLKRELRKLNRALQHKSREQIAQLPPASSDEIGQATKPSP